jgi:integrase
MRTAITKTLLDGLKPKKSPFEIRDTKLNGFMVRVQPSGAVSFIAQLGRAKRVTLGRYPACTLKRAHTLALNALNAAEGGASTAEVKALVRPENGVPATLRSFIDDTYKAWLEKNRKSGAAEAARLASAFATLLDKSLVDVNAWAIERWRTTRLKDGIKPTSINRDLNTLKACLHRAVEWGVMDTYALTTIKPMKADSRGVVRYLSSEEEVALRDALRTRDARKAAGRESGNAWRAARGKEERPEYESDHLAPMVILSLNTGLRRGELFQLRWRDVDIKRRVLTVAGATTKGGHTRHIPLTDEAVTVLEAWCKPDADPRELVFPGRTGGQFYTLKTAWAVLLTDAGISGFRWHDLRHTFASKLVQAGVDLNTVRELMGHADIKMTLRYAHLSPSHLADAINKLKPATAPAKARRA